MVLAANIHALCHSEFFKTSVNPKISSYPKKKKKFTTGGSMGQYPKSLRLVETYGDLSHLSVST